MYADALGPVGDPGLPFTYPPIAALFFVPLSIVPFWFAYALISAASYLVMVLLLTDLIEKLRWERAWMKLAAPVLVVISSPYLDTITYGQVNVVLMGVCYLTLSRFGLGWRFGVAVGLAGAIKLTPLALLLLPLVLWRWRALIGGVATFVGLQLLGGLVFSSYTRQFWGTAVWGAERVGNLGYIDNLSLRGVTERFELARGWWLFGVLASVLLCGVLVYRQRKLDGSWLLGLAATAMLLISPVSWVHHFVWWPVIVLGWAGCFGRLPRWSKTSGMILGLSLMVSPKYLLRYGGLPAESRLGSLLAAVPAAVLLLGTLCLILVTCGGQGGALARWDRAEHAIEA